MLLKNKYAFVFIMILLSVIMILTSCNNPAVKSSSTNSQGESSASLVGSGEQTTSVKSVANSSSQKSSTKVPSNVSSKKGAGVSSSASTSFPSDYLPGKANSIGNSNANSIQNSRVAAQGDWIYYSNASNNYYLFKMRSDGTKKTLLVRDSTICINVVGDWIYYANDRDVSCLYKVRTDGSMRMKMNSTPSYQVHVIGDWIYYVNYKDDDHLYRMKANIRSANQVSPELLSSDHCDNVNIVGDWIYYINHKDGAIYKVHTNGTGRTMFLPKTSGNDLNVADGWIYYVSYSSDKNSINKIRVDGTGLTVMNASHDFVPMSLNVTGGWIYFYEFYLYGDTSKVVLCKMRIDGTGKKEIFDYKGSNTGNCFINVIGQWVYFSSYEDETKTIYYRVKNDGSELKRLY